jgi:hypothetical protein
MLNTTLVQICGISPSVATEIVGAPTLRGTRSAMELQMEIDELRIWRAKARRGSLGRTEGQSGAGDATTMRRSTAHSWESSPRLLQVHVTLRVSAANSSTSSPPMHRPLVDLLPIHSRSTLPSMASLSLRGGTAHSMWTRRRSDEEHALVNKTHRNTSATPREGGDGGESLHREDRWHL